MKPHILVVDDEIDVNNEIAGVINDTGEFIVSSAYSGGEAIEKVQSGLKNNSFVDVVILDIRMPDMLGTQALKEIKKINKNIEAIMLTALDDANLAWEAYQEGAIDYIVKPFREADLLFRVKRAAQERARKLLEIKRQKLIEQIYDIMLSSKTDMEKIQLHLKEEIEKVGAENFAELPHESLKEATIRFFNNK